MLQSKPDTPISGDEISLTVKDSMLRKFLEGETCLERRGSSTDGTIKCNLRFVLDLLKDRS